MSLEQYPKLLSTLFLCDCQRVLAYGCGIDPDWQGKAGIKPNVRILRPEIFFCKQLQREAGTSKGAAKMATGEKIIGIDLGTTNSVVAIMEGKEANSA